jgi:hypothetical protein
LTKVGQSEGRRSFAGQDIGTATGIFHCFVQSSFEVGEHAEPCLLDKTLDRIASQQVHVEVNIEPTELVFVDELVTEMEGDEAGEGSAVAEMGWIHHNRGTDEEGLARVQRLVARLEQEGASSRQCRVLAAIYTGLARLFSGWAGMPRSWQPPSVQWISPMRREISCCWRWPRHDGVPR